MFLLLGDPIVYWMLKLIVFAIMLFCGWQITKLKASGREFWYWSTPVIVAYSLFIGLRWNRGADYPHYYQDLTGKLFADYDEPLYLWWIDFFKATELPFWIAFIFYSFLLILGVTFIIKKYPKYAVWAYPVFFVLSGSAENLIRQYFAAAFILFAVYQYLLDSKRSKYYILLYCVCAVSIHNSALFPIAVCVGIEVAKRYKYLNNVYIPLALFLFTYFFWDEKYFQFVSDWMQTLDVSGEDNRLAGYMDNSDRWFTSEGNLNVIMGRAAVVASLLNQVAMFFTYFFVVLIGWYITKKDAKFTIIYWLAFWAIILKNISGSIEMYGRLYEWLVMFIPYVVAAVATTDYPQKYKYLKYVIVVCFLMQFAYYGVVISIGSMGYAGCAFIWDR